jgi:hypothetical protein
MHQVKVGPAHPEQAGEGVALMPVQIARSQS